MQENINFAGKSVCCAFEGDVEYLTETFERESVGVETRSLCNNNDGEIYFILKSLINSFCIFVHILIETLSLNMQYGVQLNVCSEIEENSPKATMLVSNQFPR